MIREGHEETQSIFFAFACPLQRVATLRFASDCERSGDGYRDEVAAWAMEHGDGRLTSGSSRVEF